MRYAELGKRFVAVWVDFFVLLLPFIFFVWLQSVSRTLAFISLFLNAFMWYAYDIYFHGRWGQTIGKRNQNIRVVSLDGSRITWRQAILRSSVNLGLAILSLISTLVAVFRITDKEFSHLSWSEMAERQNQLAPYSTEINIAIYIWVWSEVIVLLFNRKSKRRALHDFIAGTVVVDGSYQPLEAKAAADTDAI